MEIKKRKLNDKEKLWLNKLLEAEFKGKEIIIQQLGNTEVFCEENYQYISINFYVENFIEKYPYEVRVPVEMRAFQENSNPIVFLLHIIDGFVNELEVFTADLSKINGNDISLDNVEYEISSIVR